MSPSEMRDLRKQKGWRLHDVAGALGVTTATLSRWERALQSPSPDMLAAWERIFTGERHAQIQDRRPRRRPRGVLSRLAELFLADVKAGLNGWDAGWREPGEVGLTPADLPSLAPDVELRGLSAVRISFNSRLQPVQEAKAILGYRATVEAEERRLIPALEKHLRPILQAVRSEHERGAVLLAGLAEMIRASASLIESARHVLDKDNNPVDLVRGPSGAAKVILEAVATPVGADAVGVLKRLGFSDPIAGTEPPNTIARAKGVATELGVAQVAVRLGKHPVTAVGAAWAVSCRFAQEAVAVTTLVGVGRLGEAFWDELRFPRPEIDAAWRRLMVEESQPQTAKQQLGMLLWSWPEVL